VIRKLYTLKAATLVIALACTATVMRADKPDKPEDDEGNGPKPCAGLPDHGALQTALNAANAADSSGLKNQMWATIVDRDGVVCAVAFTGANRGAEWPGSRVISAQKANTANAFSLDSSSFSSGRGQATGFALSTANLYAAVQPAGSLYGLQHSNPVDTGVGYKGPSSNYGAANDPMVGQKIGGVNVFGGGLALYTKTSSTTASTQVIVGGVGVSGDTSCRDHNVAWWLRHGLGLDHMLGVAPVATNDAAHPDNIIFDFAPNVNGTGDSFSGSGFGHPTCPNTTNPPVLPPVVP
jgi:uncharacterized protein GlcG (DUF336 family)